jgi:hypothetical protein
MRLRRMSNVIVESVQSDNPEMFMVREGPWPWDGPACGVCSDCAGDDYVFVEKLNSDGTSSRWTSILSGLPQAYGDVLAYFNPPGVQRTSFINDKGKWHFPPDLTDSDAKVTHWCELLPGPEDR